MHRLGQGIVVLRIAKRAKVKNPNNGVGDGGVENRDVPATDLVFGLAPLPAQVGDATSVQAQGQHARESWAPHQPQYIESSAVAQAAGVKNQKIEERAERKYDDEIG